jgi:hypothetical protein
MGDVEAFVSNLVETTSRKMTLDKSHYKLDMTSTAGVLPWTPSAEFQPLGDISMARMGTVGDGNCLLHSILFLLSPTYRAYNATARSYIAREFRDRLVIREAGLREAADAMFAEIGGSLALEESFEILHEVGDAKKKMPPEELNIEMGMLIARMFGYNFHAVQAQEDGSLQPVCMTVRNRDPALPTILVHFIGGATNIGAAADAYRASGHYEAVIVPVFSDITDRGRYTLDMDSSTFVFFEKDATFQPVKALFLPACAGSLNAGRFVSSGVISRNNAQPPISVSSNTRKSRKSSSASVVNLTDLPLEGGARRRRTQKRRAKKTRRI